MKQVFYRYDLWEDYQNGMYANKNDGLEEIRIEQAVQLFKDKNLCYEKMKYVAFNWKISAEVNFTNPSVNKQAWLVQATCCYYCGATDFETIKAWHLLTEEEKQVANNIADKVFYEWLDQYEKEKGIHTKNLFDYLEEIENENNAREKCFGSC